MNLLSVRGLRRRYGRRRGLFHSGTVVQALDGVDLEIRRGSTLALVGESGSGKSTLARCIARLEQQDSGEIWYEGKEITALEGNPLWLLRREIQLVFQDPASALNPRFPVLEIVEEPMVIQGLGSRDWRLQRAREILGQVGLASPAFCRLPLELSGGQRQRVAIARALALEPRLLILDEALSGLDLSIQAQLVNLLLDLQVSRALTYFFISHDLGLAAHMADDIAVMHQGRIVEKVPASDLHSGARHPRTRALLESIPSIPFG